MSVESVVIFPISIGLQFTAAYLAFRLIRTATRGPAWAFVAAALFLMGVRRSISFYQMLESGADHAVSGAELVALLISALMVVGVALIGPLFSATRRAEWKLGQSERRTQSIEGQLNDAIENISEGFVLFDADGRLVICNNRYKEFYGYADEDAPPGVHTRELGRLDLERGTVIHQGEPSEYLDRRASDHQIQDTFIIHMKDGRILETRDRKTTSGGIVSIQQDITEQKRTEETLRENEQRFKDFAETTSDYLWEMDADLRFSYVSEHFADLTGFPQPGLLGKTREETGIPNVDPDAWAKHLADLKAHSRFDNFVHPRTHPDGRVIWLSVNGTPVFDDDGEFQGYRGTGTDITELQAAKKTGERLSRAVENVPVGIALFDINDRLIFFNARYGKLMASIIDILEPGATFETIIRTIVERQPVKDARGREEAFIQERIEKHRNPSGPVDIRRENMWLSANEILLPDGSIFTIITDITERKLAEEALSRAHAELEQRVQERTQQLKKSEDRLVSAIDNIADGFVLYDEDDRLLLCNEQYRNMFPNLNYSRCSVI